MPGLLLTAGTARNNRIDAVTMDNCTCKGCMTCHWFRHHYGANCIPMLISPLDQGWTDAMKRQRSWWPEVE